MTVAIGDPPYFFGTGRVSPIYHLPLNGWFGLTPTGTVYPQVEQSNTQLPCLDDAANSTATGTKVQLWTCSGNAQQSWAQQSDGTFRLHGGYRLDTSGTGTSQGTLAVLDPCNGGGAQIWAPGPHNSLVQQASGLCLDDPAANATNGTQLQIWSCNSGSNQAWRLPGI
jgi:hypothetical protein